MDHLTATEKQITWAAVAVVFLSIYALANAWGGLMFVPLLTGLAALVILFLPRISPNTKAPGSKGSLLMVSGVLAAAFWLLAALTWVSWIFDHLATLDTILFLIGFASALVFGWLCWQAFQAEGGKFQFGNTDMGTTMTGAAATAPPPARASCGAATGHTAAGQLGRGRHVLAERLRHEPAAGQRHGIGRRGKPDLGFQHLL